MFIKKYKSSVEKLVESPEPKKELAEAKPKTPIQTNKPKEPKAPKKSNINNESKIDFEMKKEDKKVKTKKEETKKEQPKKEEPKKEEPKKESKQPEHLKKALEARRAKLAEDKANGIKPIKKEKKKKPADSDSDSSIDIKPKKETKPLAEGCKGLPRKKETKTKKEEITKDYFSDSDSD
jgi:hypothetical protein